MTATTTDSVATVNLSGLPKIHHACGKSGRFAFDFVAMDRGDLLATDGTIVACVPLPEAHEGSLDGDTHSMMIRGDSLKSVLAGRAGEPRSLVSYGGGSREGHLSRGSAQYTVARTGDAYGEALPIDTMRSVLEPSGSPVVEVTLNAALLSRLSKALGSDVLTLSVPSDGSHGVISVAPAVGEGRGAIMPCTKS